MYGFILCSSFSQPDDAAVFLLFLRAAKWLVGVEIPGETEPEDAATVAAGIGEGIDGIVGRDVPAAGVEHVGDEGREGQRRLGQLLADADVAVVDGLGGELREVLRRGDEVLRLNGHPSQRHDVQGGAGVGDPALITDGCIVPVGSRMGIEDV